MQTYLSRYDSIYKGIYGHIPIHRLINNNFNRNIMKQVLNQEVLREKMNKYPDKQYIQRLQNADDLNRKMFSDTGRLMSLKVFNGKYPGTKLDPMDRAPIKRNVAIAISRDVV